jgi:predicted phosphoadenosine phosphosulfate sulfurtransferase
MSNKFWRTNKLIEPFSPGKCATDRVREYNQQWRRRCYSGGIPEAVPKKVAASGRAPSWKAVAIALLQNDLHLYQLGFARPAYERQRRAVRLGQIAMHGATADGTQLELFD